MATNPTTYVENNVIIKTQKAEGDVMSQDRQLAAAVLATLVADVETLEIALVKGYPAKLNRQQKRTKALRESRARDAVSCLFAKKNDTLGHWMQILDVSAVALQEKMYLLFPLAMRVVA